MSGNSHIQRAPTLAHTWPPSTNVGHRKDRYQVHTIPQFITSRNPLASYVVALDLVREHCALSQTLDPLVGGHLEQLLVVVVPRLVHRVVAPVLSPVDPKHLPPPKTKRTKRQRETPVHSALGGRDVTRNLLFRLCRRAVEKRPSRRRKSSTHCLYTHT